MLTSIFDFLFGLVTDYGLIGLFIVSAAGSSIIVPFSAEMTFPILLGCNFSKVSILFASSVGAYVGSSFNYFIGLKSGKYALKKVKEKDAKHAQDFMDKYGVLGLCIAMIVPLPLPVDPLTIIAGITKMHFNRFTIAVLTGKTIKYALLLELMVYLFPI